MKTRMVHNRHDKNINFTSGTRCSSLTRREIMYLALNQLRIALSNILRPLVIMLGSYALMALPVSAAPFAYMANQSSNDVSVIDILTNTVVGSPIPVGFSPFGVAITPLSKHPTNKDQCKKGGWKTFKNPTFKNQGQCIRFVEHLNDHDHDHDHEHGHD